MSGQRLPCVDLDLGSSPGRWAVTVATYCPLGWWNIPNLCQRNVVSDLTPKTVGMTRPRISLFAHRATVAPNADPDIADQQRSSLATDGEAQVSVWTELVLVFLHLASDLDDATFTLLLPLLFPGSEELVTKPIYFSLIIKEDLFLT